MRLRADLIFKMRGPADGLWQILSVANSPSTQFELFISKKLSIFKFFFQKSNFQFVIFYIENCKCSLNTIQRVVPDEVSKRLDRFSYQHHQPQYKQWCAFLKLRKN
jgi:hypothetical protein